MKILKRLYLLFILSCFSTISYSQQKDIGILVPNLSNFSSVGFIYKKQLKEENKYFRVSGANISILLQESLLFNSNIYLGWEKRKFQNDNFAFIHGWTTGLFLNLSATSNQNINTSIAPNVGYLLGIHYQLSDRFYLNIEANPMLQFRYISDNTPSILLDANANQAAIWLVYNFN